MAPLVVYLLAANLNMRRAIVRDNELQPYARSPAFNDTPCQHSVGVLATPSWSAEAFSNLSSGSTTSLTVLLWRGTTRTSILDGRLPLSFSRACWQLDCNRVLVVRQRQPTRRRMIGVRILRAQCVGLLVSPAEPAVVLLAEERADEYVEVGARARSQA